MLHAGHIYVSSVCSLSMGDLLCNVFGFVMKYAFPGDHSLTSLQGAGLYRQPRPGRHSCASSNPSPVPCHSAIIVAALP